MAHLHELLAVDRDLESTSERVVEEAIVAFTKKVDLFTGTIKRYEFFDEKRQNEAAGLEERREISTSVPDKLRYVHHHVVKNLDCVAQKEFSNQEASADVIIDEEILMSNEPATLLLSLESRLARLERLYASIPTLQPGIDWQPAPDQGQFVYKAAHDIIRHKTEKTVRYKVLVEPTDKHPAQVEKWTEDVVIGQSVSVTYSGMISPAQKAALLERLRKVMFAVKQARMRANEVEVKTVAISQRLIDFITRGLM